MKCVLPSTVKAISGFLMTEIMPYHGNMLTEESIFFK
jgi:hypothetical protein